MFFQSFILNIIFFLEFGVSRATYIKYEKRIDALDYIIPPHIREYSLIKAAI